MPEHGPVCGRPLLLPHAEEVHDRGRGVPRAVRALPAVRRGQLREPGVPEGLAEADLPQPPAPLVNERAAAENGRAKLRALKEGLLAKCRLRRNSYRSLKNLYFSIFNIQHRKFHFINCISLNPVVDCKNAVAVPRIDRHGGKRIFRTPSLDL